MKQFYVELIEEQHFFLVNGKPLFAGRPDKVRRYYKPPTTILIDFKMGRGLVTPADSNMQLRSYLCMTPADECQFEIPQGYSEEFRPSSLLRFKLCPGALNLQRAMAQQGILGAGPSEDAAEGTRLHMALAEPEARRDDLLPEQLDVVEKAEEMANDFIELVMNCEPKMPFYGAIIQPRSKKAADAAFYVEDDIETARTEIQLIWDEANEPGAKRSASEDACKFCPCKHLCPEYRDWVMPPPSLVHHLPVARWSDEQMILFETKRGELQKFLDEVHEQIKAIKAANPERLPGWILKESAGTRHVKDLPAAWNALKDFIDAEKFSSACSMSITEIVRIIWSLLKDGPNKVTQKEANALVNIKLGNIIEMKPKAPSLVREKDV